MAFFLYVYSLFRFVVVFVGDEGFMIEVSDAPLFFLMSTHVVGIRSTGSVLYSTWRCDREF